MLIKKQQASHALRVSATSGRQNTLSGLCFITLKSAFSFWSANTKFTYSLLSAGKLPWNDWSLFLHQSVHSARESFGIWLAPLYS